MTPDERSKRWQEIDAELEALWNGKVHPDPAAREQDRLEWEAGQKYSRGRGG